MWRFLQSLLFQPQCPLCRRSAQDVFCRDCGAKLQAQRLSQPAQNWPETLPRFVWGNYDGTLRQAIATMKFKQQPEIGVWLGEQLAEAWLKQPPVRPIPKLNVVPIPLHPLKQQQRGFNQAERIAAGFCRLTGYRLFPNALHRQKNTQALFRLGPGDRQREIQDAFTLGKPFKLHRHCQNPWLLIDDIVTTGTTARAAKTILEAHGAQVLGIVAIASPQKPRNNPLE